jgi:hypothetical protein
MVRLIDANKKLFKLSLFLLSVFGTLMGCDKGILRDRSGDYVQETEQAPIVKIPKDVKAEPFSTDYQIPAPEKA